MSLFSWCIYGAEGKKRGTGFTDTPSDQRRDDWIRTSDHRTPSPVRYQTAPRPVKELNLVYPSSYLLAPSCRRDWVTISMRKFDLIIIGGGTAGTAAAIRAEAFGARTALVESGKLGGGTVNLGCVPTKRLFWAGESSYAASDGIDYHAATAAARQAMEKTRLQNFEWPMARLRNLTRFRGRARFVGPTEVTIGEEALHGDAFLVATGSVPQAPSIEGLDDLECLSEGDWLEMARLPRSLIIIGGGAQGLEFAQVFAHFGTEVTVLQRGSQVLSGFEPEVAVSLADCLRAEGISIRISESPRAVRWYGSEKEVATLTNDGERIYRAEEILPAVGRVAGTAGLGLEEIGVEIDNRGAVLVDDELASSLPHIYAAGDVRGGPMIENAAHKEGLVAAENALGRRGIHIDYEAIPSCVFTHPQAARVGLTESDAAYRRHPVETRIVDYSDLPKAIISGDLRGLIKMTVDKRTRRVLGCSVLGASAAEIVHEAALAIKYSLTVEDLASLDRIYPSYSQITGLVAERFVEPRVVARRPRRAA